MSEREYPFEIVHTPDGDYPRGQLPGASIVHYGPDDFKTFICIQDKPDEASGDPVCVLDFLWQPQRGAVIRVGEPNRELIVADVIFQFDQQGPVQFVYVHELGA